MSRCNRENLSQPKFTHALYLLNITPLPSLRQIALVWVEVVESGTVVTARLDNDHVLPVQRLWPALRVKEER